MSRHRYLCECGGRNCSARISLEPSSYLSDARLGRVVVAAHVNGDRIVRRAPGYVVVASHPSVLGLTERNAA